MVGWCRGQMKDKVKREGALERRAVRGVRRKIESRSGVINAGAQEMVNVLDSTLVKIFNLPVPSWAAYRSLLQSLCNER